MSKETLNLSVEKSIKQQAKKIARQRGMSVSHFFELMVAEQEEAEFELPPDSGVAQFVNAIPEADKVVDYDYKKMKGEILMKKYGLNEEDFDWYKYLFGCYLAGQTICTYREKGTPIL